jgi:hypothetical protein
MTLSNRHTVVVPDGLSMRTRRLDAARNRRHGAQVMSFEQMAARLAGGFSRAIDDDSLRVAIQAVLPVTTLGELDSIKLLPGMVNAAARTLKKVWRAGIDLQARMHAHPRLAALAQLERAVLSKLPVSMLRPVDMVAAALPRMPHAPAILGRVELDALAALEPCWHPLLRALAQHTPVRWLAGPRAVPGWLADIDVEVVRAAPTAPAVSVVSAADAGHEALEAMRWARSLLASGQAAPGDIAITAADPSRFDAHFMALRAEAGFDLHFVHGTPVTATGEGQAATALADILAGGLSHARLRRLVGLCGTDGWLFRNLPKDWLGKLPAHAALTSPGSWRKLLLRLTPDYAPDEIFHVSAMVHLLQRGTVVAASVGPGVLRGRALSIWRKALIAGPATSLLGTLEGMKQDDGLDPCVCVAWMPAAALAATPRRFVRLLGLNASRWPRAGGEDSLLPDHVVPAAELDPAPRASADCADFATIRATCSGHMVLSHSRRDSEGRKLGRSALLNDQLAEVYARRHAAPVHAMSEADRLAARPAESGDLRQAVSAAACWRNWQRAGITPHDGLVRAGHPLLQAIARRTHSASSLQLLLRNPLGYLWRYGLQWRAPEGAVHPLLLDAREFGTLVHETLELALRRLEWDGGLAYASDGRIADTVGVALEAVATSRFWLAEKPIPPATVWRRKLDEIGQLACAALCLPGGRLAHARAFAEVGFGGTPPREAHAAKPWDGSVPVVIPGTDLRISGYIDRIDISHDGKTAHVRDYKTGKSIKHDVVIGGGSELQRCLYTFAARAMLGEHVAVRASLLYPRELADIELPVAADALEEFSGHVLRARAALVAGKCLPGPDTGGQYDEFAFLLPANAAAGYSKRKAAAARDSLGDAALVWESK